MFLETRRSGRTTFQVLDRIRISTVWPLIGILPDRLEVERAVLDQLLFVVLHSLAELRDFHSQPLVIRRVPVCLPAELQTEHSISDLSIF